MSDETVKTFSNGVELKILDSVDGPLFCLCNGKSGQVSVKMEEMEDAIGKGGGARKLNDMAKDLKLLKKEVEGARDLQAKNQEYGIEIARITEMVTTAQTETGELKAENERLTAELAAIMNRNEDAAIAENDDAPDGDADIID